MLQDNGGDTLTHALPEGSPAVNSGHLQPHWLHLGFGSTLSNIGLPGRLLGEWLERLRELRDVPAALLKMPAGVEHRVVFDQGALGLTG